MNTEISKRGFATSDIVISDGIHLSPKGHSVYAEVLLEIMKNELS